ncbi:MAG: Serine/threonine protein kinase [Myxococcales bacterium]|nr:Serine/threonine protein kinase [Myxococcales bacterium]
MIGDRFRVDEMIGKGAMADVYRALDLQTHAFVALKILRHTHIADPISLARFQREGEIQALLRHRNVAALLATGITDQLQPFLAVELLRGKSLRNVIKTDGRVPARRAASFAWQALNGLSAIHQAGVLHRDLKPANIMLEPSPGPVERVVLIDFGFATFEGSAKLTAQGTVVGSLTYIAPERLRGETTDQRADIYAVGVILFELLTGTPPFASENDFDLIDLHVNQEPPHLRDLDPALPHALDAVIWHALAKHPDERFRDAAEMAGQLDLAARQL